MAALIQQLGARPRAALSQPVSTSHISNEHSLTSADLPVRALTKLKSET